MPYDMAFDPYMDQKTNILRNKLGAKTQKSLDAAEAEITYIAMFTLVNGSKTESFIFTTEFLKDIHKRIFRDIYTWAGQFRTHDISKGETLFGHAAYIESSLDSALENVEKDANVASAKDTEFVSALAHYYSELNAVHPFREGNGRTIRTFLRLLALKYGFDIEWDKMDPDENINASRAAMVADEKPATKMLQSLVVRL